jgi:phosphoribosyl 1,2-cyclic phosphodiesterase
MSIHVKFWGVRGSSPSCTTPYQQTGGHTSCVSIMKEDQCLIFDCGTGLLDLGVNLKDIPLKNIHIFLSHVHYDHVMGFPFFMPLWQSDRHINLYSGPIEKFFSIKDFIENRLFDKPMFPVGTDIIPSKITYHDLFPFQQLTLPMGWEISTFPLHHPGGSTGYRLKIDGISISYITDHEHTPGDDNIPLREFVQGSDLLIYDSAYTPEEFKDRRGWGHSTWEEAVNLAQNAQVNQLALYHHDPLHTDEVVDQVEQKAQEIFPHTFAARQGQRIILG